MAAEKTMFTFLIVFFWGELQLSAATESPLTAVTVINSEGSAGIDVTFSCDFTPVLPQDEVALASLTIAQRQPGDSNFTKTVSISSLHDGIATVQDFEGISKGEINKTTGEANLQVRYPSLSMTSELDLQCESVQIDRLGHIINHMETGKVISKDWYQRNISSTVKELHSVQKLLKTTQEKLETCNKIKAHDKRVDVLITLLTANPSWTSESWNNRVYAIFSEGFNCSRVNGYLIEINTEDEFNFLQDHFDKYGKPEGKSCFLTGAYYRDLAEPFEFLTHPGDPVYLGHWRSGEPDRDDFSKNKLVLCFSGNNLKMIDGVRDNSLCEIPLERL